MFASGTKEGIFPLRKWKVFHIFLSFVATLGNSLILIALHKESSLHPPSKLMLHCLAITDLGVGLITQPALATKLLFETTERFSICFYLSMWENITGIALSGVSLTTVTAISIDRLLALSLGLRHREIVTLRRVRRSLLSTWFGSVAFSVMKSIWTSTFL